MNCSRFRFLIQQWFDQPLSSQDERMLMQHLESCDSCHRFQHQLDQVIQSTAEVPLPDESLPTNLESLAKQIMLEIPQEKPGFMSMLQSLFPFLSGGSTKQIKPKKDKSGTEHPASGSEEQSASSNFPHVRRSKGVQDGVQSLPMSKGKRGAELAFDDDQMSTSIRLKNLQRLQPVDNDPAAGGASLGTKFGMGVPLREAAGAAEPMTLAESIRRKVSDDAEQRVRDGEWGQPAQPGFVPAGQNAIGGESGWTPGAPQQWGGQPVSGGNENTGWGTPPAVPNSNAGWGAPAVPNPGVPNPAMPNQFVPNPAPNSALNAGWGAPAAVNPPVPNPAANDGWGAPAPAAPNPAANDGWGAPAPAAPNPVANDGWGAPAPAAPNPVANDGWGAPAPAAPNPAANEGWGAPAPAAPNPAANEGWGAPAPAAPNPAANESWGAPAQAAPNPAANEGWGAPAQAAPNPAANEGWGAPAQAAPNPAMNDGWGVPAPTAPNLGANVGWTAPTQPAAPVAPDAHDGWGTAPTALPAANAGNAGWGTNVPLPPNMNPHLAAAPVPEAPTPFEQPGAGQAAGGQFDAWSEEGEQIQTGMWQAFTLDEPALGAPKTGGFGQAPVNIGAGDQGTASGASRWNTPIQQRAEAAGTTPTADGPDRWDVPISERNKMSNPAVPLPAPPVPPVVSQPATPASANPARSDASRWETPIQQQQPVPPAVPPQSAQPVAPPPVPPQSVSPVPPQSVSPAAPPPAAAPQQPGSLPTNGIMERLNSILGEDLTAMAGGSAQSGWNAAQPEPAAQGWTAPQPPAAPPVESAAAQPDFSQFDVPIQDRVKQTAGAASASAPAEPGGLFKHLDDSAIDSMFSNLGVTEAVMPASSPSSAVAPPVNAGVPVPPVPTLPAASVSPPVPAMPGASVSPPAQVNAPRISAVTPKPVPGPTSVNVPPAPQAPVAQPAPTPAAAESGGIFKQLDDHAMDKIFNTLGVKEQSVQPSPPAAPSAPAIPVPPVPVPANPIGAAGQGMPAAPPVKAAPPVAPAAPIVPPSPVLTPPGAVGMPVPLSAPVPSSAPVKQSGSGLFSVDDEAMDRIFNDLGVKEKVEEVPKINVREAVQQIRTIAEAAPPTKVEGTGRLSREEQASEPTPGKIASIGKFLLDAQDLQKIGSLTEQDLSDTKIRVLTHDASDEINKLLEHIASQPGVVGSIIVGHDGILIANSLPKEMDPEAIGILSLAIYVNTTNISKKMGHNHLHQLVSRTNYGYVVVADFGGGILVTVSNGQETEKLIPLMRSITQLVAQT